MFCQSCGKTEEEIPEEQIVYSRGYLWHKSCAKIFGDIIDFPSEGKMVVDTILSECI